MGEMTAPQIVLRPLSELVLYARNSRTHSPEQVAQIKASIVEFGFTNAILADERGIVAGHGRYAAAAELAAAGVQMKFPNGALIPAGMVPVVDCAGWSEAQRKAYIIADNKLALNAGWDNDLLRVEIEELSDLGFDMDLLGFSESEIDAILNPEIGDSEQPEEGEIPDPPAQPHSQPGDVWVCGPHRVMCGDSLSIDAWDKLMQGELADLCITDPPYNVAYESKLAGSIQNDDMADSEFREFLLGAFTCLFAVMKKGASIYVYHADTEGFNFRGAFLDAGFHLSGCLIWKKNSLVLGRSPYQWIHEPCLFGFKKGAAHQFFGGRKQTTVQEFGGDVFRQREDGAWEIEVNGQILVVSGDARVEGLEPSVIFHEKPKRSDKHPTMKPIGLLVKNIKNSARKNDIVVDAFGGSGSTMIAAEQTGLCARMMELDPRFVDVQCQRYFNLTGRVPVHAETGEPFPVEKDENKPE